MNDAWANSTDTTPPTAADGWESNGRTERDPYAEGNTAPRESRRSRSRSPVREHRGRQAPRPCNQEHHYSLTCRDESSNPGTNLHVSGLNPRVTDRHLEETFGKHGKVTKAQVVHDPHTRDSRGFGFVMMSTLEEAEAAIAALNGFVLEGSPLRVDKARRGRGRTPTPGRYLGPPKRDYYERPYAPREYDYRPRRYEEERYYRGGYDRGYDEDRRYPDRYSGRSWDDRGRSDRYEGRYGDRYEDRGRSSWGERYSRYEDSYYEDRDRDRYRRRYDDERR